MTDKREIKFRGIVSHHRPEKEGEWVYGFVVGKDYIIVGIDPTFIYKEHNIVLLQSYFPVIPGTVGQCTGLKDKNGIESYVGDKVNAKYNAQGMEINVYGYEIVFNEGRFGINGKDGEWLCSLYYLNEFEIVGNIHQELIK